MSTRHPEQPIKTDLDRFADVIKDGVPPVAAGRQIGISADQANAYMQRLRKRYRG